MGECIFRWNTGRTAVGESMREAAYTRGSSCSCQGLQRGTKFYGLAVICSWTGPSLCLPETSRRPSYLGRRIRAQNVCVSVRHTQGNVSALGEVVTPSTQDHTGMPHITSSRPNLPQCEDPPQSQGDDRSGVSLCVRERKSRPPRAAKDVPFGDVEVFADLWCQRRRLWRERVGQRDQRSVAGTQSNTVLLTFFPSHHSTLTFSMSSTRSQVVLSSSSD